MEAFFFYILAIITLVSASLVVFLRRPIFNVLFMILAIIGLAGFYILLRAEFIAMVQLIVYAGAIMVLFLFVIMLLNVDEIKFPTELGPVRWWGGALISVMIMGIVWTAVKAFSAPAAASGPMKLSNTELMGRLLFTKYLLPFEVASVLLLAAIVGAVVLVRKRS